MADAQSFGDAARQSSTGGSEEPYRPTTIQGIVYADPELREQMRKQREQYAARQEANRIAAEEWERGRPERLEAFWQMLGYTPDSAADERERRRRKLFAVPVAEAWIKETELDFINAETCATQKELIEVTRNERRRLKAARRILRELGVK